MNKASKILIKIIIVMVFALSLSNTTYALGEYTTLAPLPGTTQEGTAETNLETYIPGVFRLSIAIAAIMAFVMITFGGIMYATADAISGKSQGKEYVTNAILGLLLVLGAWVILNTINPNILRFTLSIDQITQDNANATTPKAATPMTAEEIAADNLVRSRLNAAGVSVNNGPCTLGQTRGCTNLNGLPEGAIQALIRLNSDCKCGLVITGGTEDGHDTHGVNQPIVDLRPSSTLNTFFKNTSPRDGDIIRVPLTNGRQVTGTYETAGGNAAGTSTGDHWHVVLS